MKKILLSLLLAGGVQNSFAMQGGGAAAQGGAAGSASAATADDNLSPVNKALFDAARSGDLVAVREQLAEDANVNAHNAKGVTSLMTAAFHGHFDVVQELIAVGADVNVQDDHGWSSLMIAAQKGHVEVVRALIERGANIDAQNTVGITALMIEAYNAHVKVMRALLARGVNVINAQDNDSATALMIAAKKGHVEVVRALLAGGADVNVKSNEHKTAIDYASGKPEIIALLEAHKASQAAQAASAKPVPSKAAAAKGKGKAAAAGGVARAGCGAGQTVDKTLCATVAAKILADAGTQTEPIQVGSSQATAQKRLLSSSPKSAFSKPRLSGKPSSASKMAGNESRTSGGIVVPIARLLGATSFAGLQPNIAPHVAAPPVFSLQRLIAMAQTNGTGLFGLMQLLHYSAPHVNFDAHQAEALFVAMGLDATVFVQASYADITGLQLAEVLRQNIIALCGHDVYSSNIPGPEQAALMSALNQRFAPYAQTLGN